MNEGQDALKALAAGLREVREITSLRDSSGPGAANVLNRAAVVLLVSHFESYLQALAEEYVDGLEYRAGECSGIPLKLRELHLIPVMQEVISSNDVNQRRGLLKKLSKKMVLMNEDRSLAPQDLEARLLRRVVTNAKGLFPIQGGSRGGASVLG